MLDVARVESSEAELAGSQVPALDNVDRHQPIFCLPEPAAKSLPKEKSTKVMFLSQ